MADRVARVRGIALMPGMSRNRRFYSKSAIGNAVERMRKRIADPTGLPLTMGNSHGSADPTMGDATNTVGRVVNVWQDESGNARFEADIAPTSAGRDIAALLTASRPYIGGVSIRGQWIGDPHKVTVQMPDDNEMEGWTADDLEIHGIDFTNHPGVAGARITDAQLAESVASPDNCYQILESVTEVSTLTEDATAELSEGGNAPGNGKLPYGKVTYADPGYRNGQKRYPIDTKAHTRAAWSYINKPANAREYTPSQLKRIKSRIKAAAKKFGIKITESVEMLAEDFAPIIEAYIEEHPDLAEAYASHVISTDAGRVEVDGYTSDAKKVAALANRVALSAIAAVNALDPDQDGDVDVEDSSHDEELIECACGEFHESSDQFCPSCGASTTAESTGDAARTESEAADVADTQTSGATTSPTTATTTNEGTAQEDTNVSEGTQAPKTFTSEELQEAINRAVAKATKKAAKKALKEAAAAEARADAAGTTETATATEAVDVEAIKAKALEEARAEVAEQMRQTGNMPRKGLVAPVNENGTFDGKQLAELGRRDPEAFNRMAAEAFGVAAAKGVATFGKGRIAEKLAEQVQG